MLISGNSVKIVVQVERLSGLGLFWIVLNLRLTLCALKTLLLIV